ncbi:MAG: hypothetical protein IJY97_13110 [Clostridia bacterium]|nr:hypothetical protein [Clostridia bacterium]
MNKSTKKSLIFSILAIVAIAIGIIIFCIAGESIFDHYTVPLDNNDPGAAFGGLITALAGMITLFIVAVVDLIITSMLVYAFAYFSHENALTAIAELSETGGSLKLPKFLRVFSVIEMIISGAAALITLLLFMSIFAFG